MSVWSQRPPTPLKPRCPPTFLLLQRCEIQATRADAFQDVGVLPSSASIHSPTLSTLSCSSTPIFQNPATIAGSIHPSKLGPLGKNKRSFENWGRKKERVFRSCPSSLYSSSFLTKLHALEPRSRRPKRKGKRKAAQRKAREGCKKAFGVSMESILE
ncbi:hypothetical protein IE53DRAFT_178417 [Violaceomyces palustris]|uniref:Uncharacterized protein n=1 Tax=Violaceomyces palustris TaxID=1673888 RepID=A0ACD0NSG9_9BASI|nr:hypothetical protein IE53DRAFT_178417 [Violaceomyces palustris]